MAEIGKFIVFEGLDRSGKTTASKLIYDKISSQRPAELISFPNRTSLIGKLINDYLTNKTVTLPPQAIHLLFSANRWEFQQQLKAKLKNGITVICDRYYHSGIAYSFANGLDIQWAKNPDKGILQPDLIIYLQAQAQSLAKRKGFGEQIFQKLQFQKRVKEGFQQLFVNNPLVRRINIQKLSIQQSNEQVENLVRQKFGLC